MLLAGATQNISFFCEVNSRVFSHVLDSKAISVLAAMVILVVAATGQSKHCTTAGGMLMTNLGAVDPATTMGVATGDLKGAVGATILSTEVNGNMLIFHVQHLWVTESGDTLALDPATATTTPVAPGLYAVVSYPVHLKGGWVSTPEQLEVLR